MLKHLHHSTRGGGQPLKHARRERVVEDERGWHHKAARAFSGMVLSGRPTPRENKGLARDGATLVTVTTLKKSVRS